MVIPPHIFIPLQGVVVTYESHYWRQKISVKSSH